MTLTSVASSQVWWEVCGTHAREAACVTPVVDLKDTPTYAGLGTRTGKIFRTTPGRDNT